MCSPLGGNGKTKALTRVSYVQIKRMVDVLYNTVLTAQYSPFPPKVSNLTSKLYGVGRVKSSGVRQSKITKGEGLGFGRSMMRNGMNLSVFSIQLQQHRF